MLLRKEYLNFLERKPYISFTADAGYSLTFLLHHVIWQRKSKITLELVSERNLKSLIYDCLVAFPDTLGVIAKPPIQVSIPSEIYHSLFINTEINVIFFFLSPSFHDKKKAKEKLSVLVSTILWSTMFSSTCLECNFILKNNMSQHVTVSNTFLESFGYVLVWMHTCGFYLCFSVEFIAHSTVICSIMLY